MELSDCISLLQSRGKNEREEAVQKLVEFGKEAVPAIQVLIVALKDEDATVRYFAAEALERIGPLANTAVAALIEALNDPDEYVKCKAKLALEKIGAPAVDALVLALKAQYAWGRISALEALGNIGVIKEGVVPGLIAGLSQPNTDIRYCAAKALGQLGTGAREAMQSLIHTALQDESSSIRATAAEALGNICPEEMIEIWLKDVQDSDSLIRQNGHRSKSCNIPLQAVLQLSCVQIISS